MNKSKKELKAEERELFKKLKEAKIKYEELIGRYDRANLDLSNAMLGNFLKKSKGKFFSQDKYDYVCYNRIDDIIKIDKDYYTESFNIRYKGIEIKFPKETYKNNIEIQIEKGENVLCVTYAMTKKWKFCQNYGNEFITEISSLL